MIKEYVIEMSVPYEVVDFKIDTNDSDIAKFKSFEDFLMHKAKEIVFENLEWSYREKEDEEEDEE
ncbi:MAG: hypothetical protein JXQ76_07525 [Campylobacterales bacterium]|nr:hypothetical protein [Campylobacterales bacterium]